MASVVNKLPQWTSTQAAAKLEAFAIAGCDVSGIDLTVSLILSLIVGSSTLY
jgi:hypothetical protein